MVLTIIKQAAAMKEVILAANALTNAQFEHNKNKIFQKSAVVDISNRIFNFSVAIKNSALTIEEKQSLLALSQEDVYVFARALTLTFLKRAIKNPQH